MDGWKGHRSRRTGKFHKLNMCVGVLEGCDFENRLYREGTVTGTMVDLREIASRDPDPRRTKLTPILVE